ncbi:MAG: type I-E CRISPR-associated protein Cas7/Cse4/CasC [Coriobacteriales bacterium]
MTKPLFIDVHILQTVPPSNINRDDTGSPKTARFGGVNRARVSSQAWKKATRDLFPDFLDENEIGQRTVHAVQMISDHVMELLPDADSDQAEDAAASALAATGINVNNGVTGYLLFIAPGQAKALAQLAVQHIETGEEIDKKAAKEILDIKKRPLLNAVDVAMFGRMVADASDLNVDASVQVAHAIGIGRMKPEFDYYTALDDRSPEDNAGAAMIGTMEFTSATMYRYANVDVMHLCENLGSSQVACRGIEALLKSFVMSMPTGKQNSFANHTLPAAVVIQLRNSQPVSLANAFEKPVEPKGDKSQVEIGCERLAEQEKAVDDAFGTSPQKTFVVLASPDAKVLSEALPDAINSNLETAVKGVSDACASYLNENGYPLEGEE